MWNSLFRTLHDAVRVSLSLSLWIRYRFEATHTRNGVTKFTVNWNWNIFRRKRKSVSLLLLWLLTFRGRRRTHFKFQFLPVRRSLHNIRVWTFVEFIARVWLSDGYKCIVLNLGANQLYDLTACASREGTNVDVDFTDSFADARVRVRYARQKTVDEWMPCIVDWTTVIIMGHRATHTSHYDERT